MFQEFEMDSEAVFISLTWATGCLVRNAAVRGRSWHADVCRLPRRGSSNLRKAGVASTSNH